MRLQIQKSSSLQHSTVYQTDWQQHLLQKYGNGMVFLDATYTTKYALPLFFLCVLTNSGYAVVGTMIMESEDSASVSEVLTLTKGLMPLHLTQKCVTLMRDYVTAQIVESAQKLGQQKTVCDMMCCPKPQNDNWIKCDVCGLNLKSVPIDDFVCCICDAQ
ncbi:unnamed protein product [Mytilus coruscus]|uniref:MULE transposase domain-containing protein n=1 Tax=Mytilus coruscus TaxID=42192 RepID=A0A6J8BXW5_MYTCO|nr:unnamed protein product [Mytilus coruscus]